MLNKVTLIGNLGKDPDVRSTPDGTVVTNFSLATSRRWKDKQGQKQENSEWHRIVMFGKLAEIARDYLKKGSKCYIEGRLQTHNWEKDGVTHYTTEIIASEMLMLGAKAEGGSSETATESQPRSETYADFDDDIPFNSLNPLIRHHLV